MSTATNRRQFVSQDPSRRATGWVIVVAIHVLAAWA